MKILALNGSARRRGNTDILIDLILKGSREKGHRTEKLYLYDYQISSCTDCRYCKRGDYVCCINDDMDKIYPKIEKADLIIFGAPNYWNGPPARLKLLIDRMRPFVPGNKLKGKKWAVVSPSGEGPHSSGLIVEMLRRSCDYLGMKYAGKILVKAYEKGEVLKNQKALKRASELGKSF